MVYLTDYKNISRAHKIRPNHAARKSINESLQKKAAAAAALAKAKKPTNPVVRDGFKRSKKGSRKEVLQ